MNPIVLNEDDLFGYVRTRRMMAGLRGLSPRSGMSGAMDLDPKVPLRTLLEVFKGYTCVWRQGGRFHQDLLLRARRHAIKADVWQGQVQIEVVSERDDACRIVDGIMSRFKPYAFKNEEPDGIYVSFAHLGQRGVERTTQFLRCPAWKEIRENYPAATRAGIEHLASLHEPWKHGRIVIWYGPPGTGKTFAIRSLMKAWKECFSFMVVNDPENLAGMPGYYYQVASESSETPARVRVWLKGKDGEPEAKVEQKHRLFILEDSADLILQESRSLHFDKVGKLLNMTDGLFGQGREDVFLLTFNEEVTRIDSAFLRPGRCIVRTEFERFGAADASAWLRSRDASHPALEEGKTLAELYARLHATDPARPPVSADLRPSVGFSIRR